jgi:hypothetical protein
LQADDVWQGLAGCLEPFLAATTNYDTSTSGTELLRESIADAGGATGDKHDLSG